MQSLKLLGLVALTALVATLALGSGSASATVLCDIEVEVCIPEHAFPAKTKISAKLAPETTAVFTSNLINVTCKGSTLEGETLAEQGEPLKGTITSATFSSCEASKVKCTAEVKNLPWATSLTYTKETDGTLALSSGTGGNPSVKVVCGGFINCTFGALGLEFPATGGEPAQLVANKAPLSKEAGGILCPKEASFDATYALSQSKEGNVFVTEQVVAGTKLCSQVPPEDAVTHRLKCPAGQGYVGPGVEGELAAGVAELRSPTEVNKLITCTKSNYSGRFQENGTAAAVMGGINTLTFTNNGGGACTSANYVAGNPTIQVTVESLPFSLATIFYQHPQNTQGLMDIRPGGAGPKIKLTINTMPPRTCTYVSAVASFFAEYNGVGANSSVFNPMRLRQFAKQAGSAAECPPDLETIAQVTMKDQNNANLYVAGE